LNEQILKAGDEDIILDNDERELVLVPEAKIKHPI
jgi:hypothetical protein